MCAQGKPDRAEWLQEAEEAFERILGREFTGEAKTFDELEREAVEAGDRLTAWLLEKRINAQATSGTEAHCPDCGEAGQRRNEEAEVRQVDTTRGVVAFTRHGNYCRRCRRIFFSGGPQVGPQS